ncbi:lytic transglycosylase domain-containing protein [Sphingomonas morindae]|uniref:Lytic transglycosylase domain-containing protein n=1 Tax=Sphingomonas morindae TaxID=1541170 RepID=A0ABY4X7U7_9SPHN|nr:lytic transglycosylase domain-containing protein [Sphingomonas morindae]USI73013.1 lytic transglycosylase domain-containing protein [Sphingomonas morindae]
MLSVSPLLLAAAAAAASLSPQQLAWYRAQLGLAGASPVAAAPAAPLAPPGGYAPPYAASAGIATDPVAEGLVAWRRLQQSDGLLFQEYANFLLAHPGWPGESRMRRAAESAIQADVTPPDSVIAFLTRFPPQSGTAALRLAEALYARGRAAEAQAAARRAWTLAGLSTTDEGRLTARWWATLTQADQDARMERLLWTRAVVAAQRQLAYVSPARRALYQARLAYQLKSPDAPTLGVAAGAAAAQDAGYLVDRAQWLRDTMQEPVARFELAQPHRLDAPPYDPERYMETLLTFARSTAADHNWAQAYGIAAQFAAAYAPGADLRALPFSQRDDYTSLAWLAGFTALQQLNRPADAITMFRAYADASRSPSSRSKGYYWAGRAAVAAGNASAANDYFQNAAAFPDQFYGQLALERLGRPVPAPAQASAALVSPLDRAAFESNDLVRAARILGQLGDWSDQSVFLRAVAGLAEQSNANHLLAAELAQTLGRPDLGVMAARAARPDNGSDYVRSGFPTLPVPPDLANNFSFIHGIMRQESQFDRNAVSGAGARGMMQLMPATAREQASKAGLSYDYLRLTSDPAYNMALGIGYFGRVMDMEQGNYVLAVAAYNAGVGNVRRWVAQNGDPRAPGADVVAWIEAIPFSETRGYVQNVLANTVVYDSIAPGRAGQPLTNRLSYYLGKTTPG